MSFVSPTMELGTRDFSAGYLDTPESDTLAPGASPDALNCFFGSVETKGKQRATLQRAPGSRLVTPTVVVAGTACDGLIAFSREGGPNQLIGKWGPFWYRFDEVDTFVAIPGAAGYVAGNTGRGLQFKNQLLIHDGTRQQLWDGLTMREVGFFRPSGVTAMTAGAGPGVTGTYSARYTWYDQTHDHESSPSADATASLALSNQTRVHTKPSGSPPAHVTHWRVYVRREDTSEAYWMRVATVAVGTTTQAEAVSDRTRVDPLPGESENDPPSVTFKVMGTCKGYALGFVDDSSTMHVSKQGDHESWNPKDQFKVSPGDGRGVRAVKSVGTYCVLMKPTRSYYLEGSRLPFEIVELHSEYGCVSQDAAIEVGGWLYAWDEHRGPYRTDLHSWEELAQFRIEPTLARVNRTALRDVRVVHDKRNSLIIWSVPTEYVGRNRVLLAYHYGLEAWLPPFTGLEYGALTFYVPNNAPAGVFMGDLWGRVHRLFETHRQSVPSGTVAGRVTASTSSTITDAFAAFYTGGSGLVGLPIALQAADGTWQWRRIASNTGTQITLDTTYDAAFTAAPASQSLYYIGGIRWYWFSGWLDGGAPGVKKRGHWLDLQWKPAGDPVETPMSGGGGPQPIYPSHTIQTVLRFDDGEGGIVARAEDYSALTGSDVWGSAIWGVSLWGAIMRRQRKLRINRAFRSVQLGVSNFEPDQATEITGFSIGCDILTRGRVRSAGA